MFVTYTKKQLALLMYINQRNKRPDTKIPADLDYWAEMGVKSIDDLEAFYAFDRERQQDLFEQDANNREEESEYWTHLEMQANEHFYYRGFE